MAQLAIPLIALGGLYVVSKQRRENELDMTEGFETTLPNTDIPNKNYPSEYPIVDSELTQTESLTVNNHYNGSAYTDNYFKPENDIQENYWFTLKDEDLTKFTGLSFSPYIIFEINESNDSFPIPKNIEANLSNNHLKYSLTWFSLAISIFLIYLYFRKKNY